MGRAKIPRKSTSIDMTAMCDVAFLLLTFFILATKQKPPEAVAVIAPTSVSSKAAPEKSFLITLTKEGKCFLIIGDDTKKKEIYNDLNTTKGLGLSAAELAKLNKQTFVGVPLGQLKGFLDLENGIAPDKMPGIPIVDSTNNELVDWLRSISNVYAKAGTSQRDLEEKVVIKGDNLAKYPAFKNIKYALKQNAIFKFKIATNSETVPKDSELYIENQKAK
jgi:biopolymer transport protein ExbD